MTTVISTKARSVAAVALDAFDGGTLQIRTGSPPGPNAAVSGTLLASITLPTPAFTESNGVLTLSGTWQDSSANATGTAGHFRIIQSGDAGGATGSTDERIEGTVTVTGGGGDLTLTAVNITAGDDVTITSATLTVPAS